MGGYWRGLGLETVGFVSLYNHAHQSAHSFQVGSKGLMGVYIIMPISVFRSFPTSARS